VGLQGLETLALGNRKGQLQVGQDSFIYRHAIQARRSWYITM